MRTWDSKLPKRTIKLCTKYGAQVTSTLFTLRALVGSDKTHIVLVVSKRAIHRHATIRNFAKRRMRAALDQILLPTIHLNCVLFLNRAVLDVKFVDLVLELAKQFAGVAECVKRVAVEC